MTHSRTRRLRLLTVLLTLTMFASACGSDAVVTDGGSTTDTEGPTTGSPSAREQLDASTVETMVDDYGCGHGFAKGNADQTVALLVHFAGNYNDGGPDVSAAIALPDPAWRAEIQVGSDLFSNWCDDVIEQDEPTPAVATTWTIVAGTLSVEGENTGCDGTAVTGTLSGAQVESVTGGLVELGDIELANTAWGCFAG